LPEVNQTEAVSQTVAVELNKGRDNPIYIRARTEDGHLCWSSPVYLID